MSTSYRVRRSVEKNAPEVKALASRRMPRFAIPFGRTDAVGPPVFCFHDVGPEGFSAQLRFLRDNGYRSLDADEVELRAREGSQGGREVALTFDDATWTFWTYAFPLLREYGFRAILFAIPTTLADTDAEYPTWEDHRAGRCGLDELLARSRASPFCTWGELQVMHRSGVVDVQSHSLTHVRVPVAPRVLDFVHPGFDPYCGNFDVPLSVLDEPERDRPAVRLGAPLFASAPRLSARLRFRESPAFVEELTSLVESRGGASFFADRRWRGALKAVVNRWPEAERGSYESPHQLEGAVRRELVESKRQLERRLPGKTVRHFAYPWHAGSPLADGIAAEAGYHTVFGGPDTPTAPGGTGGLLRVQRIGEEYLQRLPGRGRHSLWSVWGGRFEHSRGRDPAAVPETTLATATRTFYWKPAYAWFRSLELHAYEGAGVRLEGPVLDLGCGDGRVAEALAARGVVARRGVFGIDYKHVPLTRALEGAAHTGVVRADAHTLPFADATFQSVVSNGVLCAIPEGVEACLDEVARVLRPGGVFVATVPTDRFIDAMLWPGVLGRVSERARALYERRINRRLDHLNAYASVDEWRARCECSGLTVEHVEGFLSPRAGKLYNVLAMQALRFFGVLRGAPGVFRRAAAKGLRRALQGAYRQEIARTPRPGYVLILAHRETARASAERGGRIPR